MIHGFKKSVSLLNDIDENLKTGILKKKLFQSTNPK